MRLVDGDSLAGEPARLAGTLRGPPGRSELPLIELRLTDERLTDVRPRDGRPPPSRACGPADADLRLQGSRTQLRQSNGSASSCSEGCGDRTRRAPAKDVIGMPPLCRQVLIGRECNENE